jgi:hypothetical protein
VFFELFDVVGNTAALGLVFEQGHDCGVEILAAQVVEFDAQVASQPTHSFQVERTADGFP